MKVIILIGLPGSGKSTFASKHFPNHYYINQDKLGHREACIKQMIYALEHNKDIIIDRTNINKQQRKYFIDLALQYGAESVIGIYLDVLEEECIARIHARKRHETIYEGTPLDKKREIVYSFNKSFQMPTLDEGFSTIVITRN